MRDTTVSVAMAACEGARWIDEQLASIAAQTRPPDQLIVCDDASKDATAERVEAFAAQAAFDVRLVRNPSRLGITRNFEQAVSLCDADVILLADQDDIWLPGKIAACLASFEARPEAGLVFSNGLVVDADGSALGYDLWQAISFSAAEQAAVERGQATGVFLRHVVAAGTTLAFRGRYRDALLPFPPIHSTHDAWIAFFLSAVSDCILIHEPLIHYRLHGENQIGLEKYDLRAQYAQARLQIERRAFARQSEFFEFARARLAALATSGHVGLAGAVSSQTLAGIDAKVAHCRTRDQMAGSLFARLPTILREAVSGHYRRYSYGIKSIAQDLFMR
jgi:glycosyltransferase involved in cell wall biosynthesis